MKCVSIQKGVCFILWIALLVGQCGVTVAVSRDFTETKWVRTPQIRVVIKSTADWVKMMFDDDQDGSNQNGIRIVSLVQSGWQIGGKEDYDMIISRKMLWHDVHYDTTVLKFGDMVSFNKGPNDFNYTVLFADLVLDVDVGVSAGYVWLMLAGRGTTSFELMNLQNKYVFWRETLIGTGHTSHVRRLIMIESFFRSWDVSSLSIGTLVVCTLLVMLVFSPLRRLGPLMLRRVVRTAKPRVTEKE